MSFTAETKVISHKKTPTWITWIKIFIKSYKGMFTTVVFYEIKA